MLPLLVCCVGVVSSVKLPRVVGYFAGYENSTNTLTAAASQSVDYVLLFGARVYSDQWSESFRTQMIGNVPIGTAPCTDANNTGVACAGSFPIECCPSNPTQKCPGRQPIPQPPGVEPAGCCWSASGVDARYASLRNGWDNMMTGVVALKKAGKQVGLCFGDDDEWKRLFLGVEEGGINTAKAARSIAAVARRYGFDGADFNVEDFGSTTSQDCCSCKVAVSGAACQRCPYVSLIKGLRTEMGPQFLLSYTTYQSPDSTCNSGILHALNDTIDFVMLDDYSTGASSGWVTYASIVGTARLYEGVQCENPLNSLTDAKAIATRVKHIGAGGVFIFTLNRDTNTRNDCMDENHASSPWSYTQLVAQALA